MSDRGRPSPLPNRVEPTGEIVAHPARGLLMGNRGCLHTDGHELRNARWRTKSWICCVLDWRGRRRDVMPPGRWTALFFLDEATALAAGHRPCGYCRRSDLVAYAHAWQTAMNLPARPKVGHMDQVLHSERVDPRTRRHLTRPVRPGDLPDGAMVRLDRTVWLCYAGTLRPWSWEGYGPPAAAVSSDRVELLTPPSTVSVLAAGYRPLIHPSVDTVSG